MMIMFDCVFFQGKYFINDFAVSTDMLQPFLPNGKFKSIASVARLNGEQEFPLAGITVTADIENAQDKRGFKLF